MGSQRVLRFCISPRETFLTLIVFTEVNKYDKGAMGQISTVFRPVYHVTFRRVLRNGTLESESSKIHELGGSSFFKKC